MSETYRERELRLLAEQTRDAEMLRVRRAFHTRWSNYWKCRGCGGRIDATVDAYGPVLSSQRCPHGDHQVDPVRNGYSWTMR